jgi:hypothetical protein
MGYWQFPSSLVSIRNYPSWSRCVFPFFFELGKYPIHLALDGTYGFMILRSPCPVVAWDKARCNLSCCRHSPWNFLFIGTSGLHTVLAHHKRVERTSHFCDEWREDLTRGRDSYEYTFRKRVPLRDLRCNLYWNIRERCNLVVRDCC